MPDCLSSAKADLVEGMSKSVEGFIAFMQDANIGELLARAKATEAHELFAKFEKQADACSTPAAQ